jgi:hypothetical protein
MTRSRFGGAIGVLLGIGGASCGAPARAADVTIENEFLRIHWDEATREVAASSPPGASDFLYNVQLSEGGGEAAVVAVKHPLWGNGQALEIVHAGEDSDRVMLFPRLPFALVQSRQVNPTDKAEVIDKRRTLTAEIDLDTSTSSLRSFGTGGLLPIDKNPGSYAWLAVVEPQTRAGAVFGWLTHDRGSGVLFTRQDGDDLRVDAQIDYGRLTIAPGESEDLETLVVGYFDDARLGLEAWADAVAKVYDIHLPAQPVGYCTWYSKPHGGASDEKHLAEVATFAAERVAPYGFSVVQIDDKWQAGTSTNGPTRDFTQHRVDGPYPSGMQAAAAQVSSLGLTPGLWYMPFAGTHYDPVFKDRQDWFVKRKDGMPYETSWGGTCLDLTRPEVREYVRSVADRIVKKWGYRYLKLDGLWTGTATRQQYVNSGYKDDNIGDAVFHDPAVTNVEAYRSGLKLVREAVGRDTFILGCNGPQNMRSYGGAFGLVDAMRVGPDNGAQWDKLLRGPMFGSRHYFLHGRVWYNDPDPVYVREEMPLEQAQMICSWVALSGQLNLSSEWLPGLSEERLQVLQRTMPGHGLRPRPVDLFEHDPPRMWLLTDDRGETRRDVVGVFNWTDKDLDVPLLPEAWGLEPELTYEAFDYWANKRIEQLPGKQMTVPARSCVVLAVRPEAPHPQLLSTSRHVTQGIVDVTSEHWDAASRTLSGVSKVIGGDEYELRIVAPTDDGPNVANSAEAAAARATLAQEGQLVRILIQSPATREIAWSVRFGD